MKKNWEDYSGNNLEGNQDGQDKTNQIRQVKDCNGILLQEGDNATLTKSLKLKGSATTLKQGAIAKKIHLTDSDDEVDCKVDNMAVVLKTEFLKKLQ